MSIRRIFQLFVLLTTALLLVNCSDGSGGGTVETTNPPEPSEPLSLLSPARVEALPTGDLVVSDYTENKFCLLDKNSLEITMCFAAKGQPTGVVYTENDGGLYFVGNRSVCSVDVFDAQGQFIYHLGGTTGVFKSVNDLAVDSDARVVYVLDTKAKVVRLFNFNGTDTGLTIGAGILNQPTALTIDAGASSLFVSDYGDPTVPASPSVKGFDLVTRTQNYALPGGSSRFSSPQGIWVDNGNVFLVDVLSGEVQVWRQSDNTRIAVLGQIGSELGELMYPLDVLVDSTSKDVFVADNRNGRITVFRGGGIFP